LIHKESIVFKFMIAVQLVYEEGFLSDWTFDCVNFKICFRNVKNATEIVLKIKFK